MSQKKRFNEIHNSGWEFNPVVGTCLASTESWVWTPALNLFVCCAINWTQVQGPGFGLQLWTMNCTMNWTHGRHVRQVFSNLVKIKFLTKDTADTRNEKLTICSNLHTALSSPVLFHVPPKTTPGPLIILFPKWESKTGGSMGTD